METIKITSSVFGVIRVDAERITEARRALETAYQRRDKAAIAKAAHDVRQYVDEGLDDYVPHNEFADNCLGHFAMLANEYITRVFHDRYVDDDDDKEYIETGLKPYMRRQQESSCMSAREPRQLMFNF